VLTASLLGLLVGGSIAQEGLSAGVLEESWDMEIEMLEPDLDFLLDSLEAESCYCACDDWCSGACEGTSACETWCVCPVEVPVEPVEPVVIEPDEVAPEAAPEAALEYTLASAVPVSAPPLEPPVAPTAPPDEPAFEIALERVFQGDVSVPTCRCVWRLEGERACNASVEWPAEGEDCDCSRFETPPGCDGDALVISVILGAPENNRRR